MNQSRSTRVSAARKALFYGGYLLQAAGALAFVALFFRYDAASRPSGIRSLVLQVVAGFALLFLGALCRRLGIRGLAGSLLILDPPKAREDLAPWTRAAGGMVGDAISAAKEGMDAAAAKRPRCPRCGAFNEERARYCNQCAAALDGSGSAPTGVPAQGGEP